MKRIRKNAFTIFEVLLSFVVLGFIAGLLSTTLNTITNKQTLEAALDKNTTYFQQVHQSILMFQTQGKIAPGAVDIDKFMRALVLTSKCIDLKPNGTQIANNRKFSTYIYGNADVAAIRISTGVANYNSFAIDVVGDTVILKNNVIVSKNSDNKLVIDVNGRKGPNVVGRDIYIFNVNESGLELQP